MWFSRNEMDLFGWCIRMEMALNDVMFMWYEPFKALYIVWHVLALNGPLASGWNCVEWDMALHGIVWICAWLWYVCGVVVWWEPRVETVRADHRVWMREAGCRMGTLVATVRTDPRCIMRWDEMRWNVGGYARWRLCGQTTGYASRWWHCLLYCGCLWCVFVSVLRLRLSYLLVTELCVCLSMVRCDACLYMCICIAWGGLGICIYQGGRHWEGELAHTTPVRAMYENCLHYLLTEHSCFAHPFTLYVFQVLSDCSSSAFEFVSRGASFGFVLRRAFIVIKCHRFVLRCIFWIP